MDNEQARFVLRSFRPDGADTGDEDFAEALRLAVENRELGEWLAKERAFDAAFAEALASVGLPETLREDILACLAVERGDLPQAGDVTDAQWIGALATVQPPPALRDQILAAMDRTANAGSLRPEEEKVAPIRRGWTIPLAVAAAVALAFLVSRPRGGGNPGTVSMEEVRTEVEKTLADHGSWEEEGVAAGPALAGFLASRDLPALPGLPPGLREKKGFGCSELNIGGKRGALLCFHLGDGRPVHLVIFRREDVGGKLPAEGHPVLAQNGDWATARWSEGDKVMMMVSNTNVEKLSAIF